MAGADAGERARSEPVASAVAGLVPALLAAGAALVLAVRFAARRRRAGSGNAGPRRSGD